MKYNLLFIFSLLIFNIFCKKEHKEPIRKYNLLQIDFHPTFHQPAEVIIDFTNETISFTNNSPIVLQEPVRLNEENPYENNYPELIPFTAKLSKEEVNKLISILDNFSDTEFNKKEDLGIDGMDTTISIFMNDLKIITLPDIHNPTTNEMDLFYEVLNFIETKTKDKSNKIISKNIARYVH